MKQYMFEKAKQFLRLFVYSFLPLAGGGWVGVSCSEMLETESTRQNIEPEIKDKTDSVFYAFGILQAMQQVADQYVMQGEMRGDLVKTTLYTDNNLRQLYNFSAGTDNKYDSAYVYYRVINNCNYYIAHCDTTLASGATNLVMDKYIATYAIRAWAYLQLGRNYERVPFFTEPLTQISQIDRNYPELTLTEIVAQLAPELESLINKYPTYNRNPVLGPSNSVLNIGSPNWEGTAKTISLSRCFIPADIILGDMYLETGNYASAATHFVNYFTKSAFQTHTQFTAPLVSKKLKTGPIGTQDDDLPDRSLMSVSISGSPWSNIFSRNNLNDIITYIPMATTAQNGTTTEVPKIFGFDYYATPEEKSRSGAPYIDEIQLLPSAYMEELSDSTEYYYYASHLNQTDVFDSVNVAKCGDMRMRSIIHQEASGDTAIQWIDKYKYANVILYRVSTVWLKLAEAFNRLGMPDLAFAILKDGIGEIMLETSADGSYLMNYLTDESRNALQVSYPLLSETNRSLFEHPVFGIHAHGAGWAVSDYPDLSGVVGGTVYHTGKSPYQLNRMAGLKMDEIAEKYSVSVGTTKQDTINAVEDLICDEYALESAFEGNRYFDLLRLARHKNEAGLYGGNFGDLWLQNRLGDRGWTPAKKYLPFK